MDKKTGKVAWITDTTCTLSEDFINENQIYVVPLHVVINGESYKENIDISDKQFYERMEHENVSFQSSQPSVGEFIELYEKLKEEYDYGFVFHCSSKLSGTFSTSVMAAEQVGFKLFAVDTRTGSYPHSYLLKKGMELYNQGYEAEEIVKMVEDIKTRTKLFLIPLNLNQLHKSGRVSGSQRLIARVLNIKPILSVELEGAVIKDKVRTEKRAIQYMIDLLKEDMTVYKVSKIAIIHANVEEKAIKLESLIQEQFESIPTERMILVPVAGVHTGVGTIGISWVCE